MTSSLRPATAVWSADSWSCSGPQPSRGRGPGRLHRAAARWSRVRGYEAPEPGAPGGLNQAFTVLRRARRQLRLLGRPALGREPPELPSDVVEVVAAMRRLPATQREVLVLHYLVEFTLDEVARHLRIAGGTAKRRLTRGRRTRAGALGLADSREDVRGG